MKKLFSILLILSIGIFAQRNPGAKQIALSNSDVALSNDVFSLFNNVAGLSQINWREIGIYYSPAPFGIKELANGYISYIEPSLYGAFSIGAMTYGFELYRETKLLVGYSNEFQKKFFYGISINFHNVNIKNYGSDLSYYINIGALAYLLNNLRFGFLINNVNRATFSNEKDQIPTYMNIGLSYDILNELTLNISIDKDLKYAHSFQFGIDYDIIEHLSIRSGFSNNPSNYSAGIGINYSMFNLDYAIFSHSDLGLSHQIGLLINFDSIQNRKQAIRNFLGVEN
ncbi:MAG: hypothetical protein N2043_08080 [Ignavibacterium sp.]|nr:hypothetical protein [Ignavibacterium sp.]